MSLSIQIPIKSYIKKWLIEDYFIHPLDLSTKGELQKLISRRINMCIVSQSQLQKMAKDEKYDDSMEVALDVAPCDAVYYSISLSDIVKINKTLISWFDESLYVFIKPFDHKRNDIRDRIFQFMEHYDITDDDIDYDSLRKKYFRYRKQLNSTPSSPIKKPNKTDNNDNTIF